MDIAPKKKIEEERERKIYKYIVLKFLVQFLV